MVDDILEYNKDTPDEEMFDKEDETLSDKLSTDLWDLVKYGEERKGYLKREDVRAKLKEEKDSLKTLFCMNPDVGFCDECWACRGIDNIHKKNFGEDLVK